MTLQDSNTSSRKDVEAQREKRREYQRFYYRQNQEYFKEYYRKYRKSTAGKEIIHRSNLRGNYKRYHSPEGREAYRISREKVYERYGGRAGYEKDRLEKLCEKKPED